MNKITCKYCGQEIDKLLYWSNPVFNTDQNGETYYYCGADCSTKHYQQRGKQNENN